MLLHYLCDKSKQVWELLPEVLCCGLDRAALNGNDLTVTYVDDLAVLYLYDLSLLKS